MANLRWQKLGETWTVYGPEDVVKPGATVQVTSRDGRTSDVLIERVARPIKTMTGIWYTNGFPAPKPAKPAPAPVVAPAPEPVVTCADAPAAPALTTPKVFNGRHTLTKDSEHYTFRISTSLGRGKIEKGKRILSVLDGPDNENDYRGIGFIDDNGVQVWARWRGTAFETIVHKFWIVMSHPEGSRDGWEVLTAGSCVCCNRALTTPESIRTGIGPVCADREGGVNDKATLRKIRRLRRLQAQLTEAETT